MRSTCAPLVSMMSTRSLAPLAVEAYHLEVKHVFYNTHRNSVCCVRLCTTSCILCFDNDILPRLRVFNVSGTRCTHPRKRGSLQPLHMRSVRHCVRLARLSCDCRAKCFLCSCAVVPGRRGRAGAVSMLAVIGFIDSTRKVIARHATRHESATRRPKGNSASSHSLKQATTFSRVACGLTWWMAGQLR